MMIIVRWNHRHHLHLGLHLLVVLLIGHMLRIRLLNGDKTLVHGRNVPGHWIIVW